MSNALHILYIFLAIVGLMILLRAVHLRETASDEATLDADA